MINDSAHPIQTDHIYNYPRGKLIHWRDLPFRNTSRADLINQDNGLILMYCLSQCYPEIHTITVAYLN